MKNKILFCIFIILFVFIKVSYVDAKTISSDIDNNNNNNNNIIIVKNEYEIEKYKKFFVNFMPNKFKLNEKNQIILTNKYKNNLSDVDDDIFVSFIKSGNIKNDNFKLIFVWSYKVKSGDYYDIIYNYEIFYQKFEHNDKYDIGTYSPLNCVGCFFGIINNNACISKFDFKENTEISKKEFNEFIKKFKL